MVYNLPDKIVFQTPDAMAHYSKSIQKRGVVIPNPVSPYLPQRFEGERTKEIVAMGRLAAQKNFKMMIDAFAMLVKEHPEYKLIIYGKGPQQDMLEQRIRELSLEDKVLLPGFVTDIHDKILKSAMYVSSSNYEGISNSMLESLGMGIPSVVTDCPVGGAKMFVRNDENGVLVPVGDVDAFYEGMKKIAEDKDFAEKISKNAVKIREELDADRICKKWLDLV